MECSEAGAVSTSPSRDRPRLPKSVFWLQSFTEMTQLCEPLCRVFQHAPSTTTVLDELVILSVAKNLGASDINILGDSSSRAAPQDDMRLTGSVAIKSTGR